MKNTLIISALALLFAACQNDGEGVQEIRTADGPNAGLVRNPISADQPLDTNKLARISFTEAFHDFGTIKEGDEVEYRFKFVNTGKVPLLISNARSSCGCTTPDWPKEPVPPGGTGEILAHFNSEGKTGDQKKLIVVTANTFPAESSVRISAQVTPK